jgi:hypothetical protein
MRVRRQLRELLARFDARRIFIRAKEGGDTDSLWWLGRAEPFYRALGYEVGGLVEHVLSSGDGMPAVKIRKNFALNVK